MKSELGGGELKIFSINWIFKINMIYSKDILLLYSYSSNLFTFVLYKFSNIQN